jgi:hypothetical protein
MVILGLLLGVVIAVIVAAHGCGENHSKRRTFHGAAPIARDMTGTQALSPRGAAASAARARA